MRLDRETRDDRGAAPIAQLAGVDHGGEGGLLGLAVGDGHLYAYVTTADGNRVTRATLTGEPGAHAVRGPSPWMWAWMSRLGTVWFLLLLIAVACVTYPGFAQGGNLRNILFQNAPIGLIAVGMTFAMISGGFDLSVGAIVAMSSVTYAKLALAGGLWQAAVITLLLGLGLGLINGVWNT